MTASLTHAAPRPPIDCHDAVRQLWDFLDGELDAERYADIAAHVEGCRGCGEHYAFARRFLAALGAPPGIVRAQTGAGAAPDDTDDLYATPDGDAQALRARVVAALQREGFRTPPE